MLFGWFLWAHDLSLAIEPTSGHSLEVRRWVDELGANDFASREAAAGLLIQLAERSECDRECVLSSLRNGLFHRSLETRLRSKHLTQRIQQKRVDEQLSMLTNPKCDTKQVELAGWRTFASIAGDDSTTRAFFAKLYRSNERRIERLTQSDRLESSMMNRTHTWLDRNSIDGWALAILADCTLGQHHNSNGSLFLLHSLTRDQIAPPPFHPTDGVILHRLIGGWLYERSEVGCLMDHLLVAMRYHCRDHAASACDRILCDTSAPASWQGTAVLSSALLSSKESTVPSSQDAVDQQLLQRLNDRRRIGVVMMIPEYKKVLHTEVRDVALATLLYRHQIDPRMSGFVDLQADPALLFRVESLGFATATERELAHKKGRELLRDTGLQQ